MGNEESLVGFPVKQVVPALVSKLFKTEHTSLGCKVNKTKLLTFNHDTEENCVAWSKILFTQHITLVQDFRTIKHDCRQKLLATTNK